MTIEYEITYVDYCILLGGRSVRNFNEVCCIGLVAHAISVVPSLNVPFT